MQTTPYSVVLRDCVFHVGMMLLGLAMAAGCNRAYYRQQADDEVYQAVETSLPAAYGPRGEFTIEPDPRSRMFDPFDPDHPPMPPDDPDSHLLMHCVDGKRGWPHWHDDGETDTVENPDWLACLPVNEDGSLTLDMHGAVATALLESPNFQRQLEELYLSALDVTFERFRFDVQFFGGSDLQFTSDGPLRGGPSSQLFFAPFDPANRLRAEKMFATGSQMVVGLANSFVWEFSGPNTETVNTLLDFSIVQPLLRGAGRARVLERLTITERTLLANVRQMERFRRGFYAQIVTGRNAGQGPSRRGGVFGGSGLQGFSGVGGGGFGGIGGAVAGVGGGGGGIAGGAGAAGAGGFLGLLQELQQIRNQEANVTGLRDSAAQLQAANEAGRIDRFQADLALQALYNAQSRLMTAKAAYQSRLDSFKITLGLPSDLAIRVDESMLDQFNLIDPALVRIQNGVNDLLDQLNQAGDQVGGPLLERVLVQALRLQDASRQHLEIVHQDYQRLMASLPARREALKRLSQRKEVVEGEVGAKPFDVGELNRRVESITQDSQQLDQLLNATWNQIDALNKNRPAQAVLAKQLAGVLTQLSGQLLELSLVQARTRLDTIVVSPIPISPTQALAIASSHRRDWKNARAGLVDAWRLIEFNANDLESSLDLTFSGDISNTNDNPVRFRDTTGRLRVGVEFDTPLTRLSERNNYRQALIEYQQARRAYYTFVDRVNQGLRNTLRTIRLNELNMELRRAAVETAISQVDLARLRLVQPPQPGATTQFGATTARDLVQALSDLLSVQNDFLSVWVNYEVQRIGLDLDLGTMQLDPEGMWIDPGSEIGQVEDRDEPFLPCEDAAEVGPVRLPTLEAGEKAKSGASALHEPAKPAAA